MGETTKPPGSVSAAAPAQPHGSGSESGAYEPVAAVQCADCKTVVDGHESFTIIPPTDRTEGGGRMYWLCQQCWDSIVAGAVMSRLRGF